MGAFGGGLGGNGEVCGAVVGALGVLGLRFGRGREEEKEDPKINAYSKEVLQGFREIVKNHGGIHCLDIAGVDWKDRDQARAFYKGEKIVDCRRIVGDTAYMVGELLERESLKS
jgi:C_GCAxxG_C_C family probable redox protein